MTVHDFGLPRPCGCVITSPTLVGHPLSCRKTRTFQKRSIKESTLNHGKKQHNPKSMSSIPPWNALGPAPQGSEAPPSTWGASRSSVSGFRGPPAKNGISRPLLPGRGARYTWSSGDFQILKALFGSPCNEDHGVSGSILGPMVILTVRVVETWVMSPLMTSPGPPSRKVLAMSFAWV